MMAGLICAQRVCWLRFRDAYIQKIEQLFKMCYQVYLFVDYRLLRILCSISRSVFFISFSLISGSID